MDVDEKIVGALPCDKGVMTKRHGRILRKPNA